MRKLLLTLGTIAAVATPVAAVVACGAKADPIKPKASAGAGATVDAALIDEDTVITVDPKGAHPIDYVAPVTVGGASGPTTIYQ